MAKSEVNAKVKFPVIALEVCNPILGRALHQGKPKPKSSTYCMSIFEWRSLFSKDHFFLSYDLPSPLSVFVENFCKGCDKPSE